MNTARIVALTFAVGAGGVAAYPANGFDNKPPATKQVPQPWIFDVSERSETPLRAHPIASLSPARASKSSKGRWI